MHPQQIGVAIEPIAGRWFRSRIGNHEHGRRVLSLSADAPDHDEVARAGGHATWIQLCPLWNSGLRRRQSDQCRPQDRGNCGSHASLHSASRMILPVRVPVLHGVDVLQRFVGRKLVHVPVQLGGARHRAEDGAGEHHPGADRRLGAAGRGRRAEPSPPSSCLSWRTAGTQSRRWL